MPRTALVGEVGKSEYHPPLEASHMAPATASASSLPPRCDGARDRCACAAALDPRGGSSNARLDRRMPGEPPGGGAAATAAAAAAGGAIARLVSGRATCEYVRADSVRMSDALLCVVLGRHGSCALDATVALSDEMTCTTQPTPPPPQATVAAHLACDGHVGSQCLYTRRGESG